MGVAREALGGITTPDPTLGPRPRREELGVPQRALRDGPGARQSAADPPGAAGVPERERLLTLPLTVPGALHPHRRGRPRKVDRRGTRLTGRTCPHRSR